MSARLSRRKLENIKTTGARVAITSNAGCALQIAREAREQGEQLAVVHPMEMLDWSYRGEQPSVVKARAVFRGPTSAGRPAMALAAGAI